MSMDASDVNALERDLGYRRDLDAVDPEPPDVPRPVSVQRAQDRAGPTLGDRRMLMVNGHEELYVYIGAGTWMLARACGKIPRKETK